MIPFSPVAIRFAIVLALIAAVLGILYKVREDGRRDALAAVERANAEAEARANEGERNVLTCPPELWSRELRRCATKLH